MNPDSITIDRATLQDAQLQEVVELVAYNRERGSGAYIATRMAR